MEAMGYEGSFTSPELEGLEPIWPDLCERRTSGRIATVLLTGKLSKGAYEHACLVRNLSRRGMMLRSMAPLSGGDHVLVELRGLPAADAVVRWTKGGVTGIEFGADLDIQQILKPGPVDGHKARSPRFDVNLPGRLTSGTRHFRAELVDISQAGAKLELKGTLEAGEPAILAIQGFEHPFVGNVRWSRSNFVGLQFSRALCLEELDLILARSSKLLEPFSSRVSRTTSPE
jgi:hypothetical protein